jgi:hypothetical protein
VLPRRVVDVRDDDARASATKRRTVAAPMPDAPPVTIATLPSSRPMPASLSRVRHGCKQTLVWEGETMALEFGLFYEIPVAAPARAQRA